MNFSEPDKDTEASEARLIREDGRYRLVSLPERALSKIICGSII